MQNYENRSLRTTAREQGKNPAREKPCHSSSSGKHRAASERQETELQTLPCAFLRVKHCATKSFPGMLSLQLSERRRRVLRRSALSAALAFK